jgi:predicted ATPase/DNA-binding winged helix-turn-helix (wHTH) protein
VVIQRNRLAQRRPCCVGIGGLRYVGHACQQALEPENTWNRVKSENLIYLPIMDQISETPTAIDFGRFSVLPQRRELLAEGRPMALGGRAFDVLMALIEASGAVVSKDALIKRVWPNRIVEENSLVSQISALRKAFAGDRDLIRTIAGRGYQFTGSIRTISKSPDELPVATTAVSISAAVHAPTNLPEPVSELIGREVELDEILSLTAAHRLVTLAGAGGIGKTRLGIEVARHLLPRFADGVWLVELAPLSDPDLVPNTVATALGIEVPGGVASVGRVANALASKHLMLVLDNCEHVVDTAAQMAEMFLRASPATRVIVTSRDPLRVDGEWVFPVPPLAVPMEGGRNGEDPLRYGAVRLFVERARAAASYFSTDASVVATIAAICRRLDGIPLAIELAAARAGVLGIEELASRLDDRFELLTGGRRTAPPRQRTLRATLDWSYDLLPEVERLVLRRLSVFAGGFTHEAACAVAASAEITWWAIVDCIVNLVEKSLVAADVRGPKARFRLLETTRTYALEKLTESGERGDAARRHAEYYRDLFQRAATESETRPAADWLAAYGLDIDNVRAALDWAFSTGGDPTVGVALTIASVPHWFRSSRMEECRGRVERALASVGPGSGYDTCLRMQLFAAHALSLRCVKGYIREADEAWETAVKLAHHVDETNHLLPILWGQWRFLIGNGETRAALAQAERFCRVAADASDPADIFVGDLMVGISQHYLGSQTAARCQINRTLDGYRDPVPASHTIRFLFDQSEQARAYLARVVWLQGFPDQAMRIARNIAENAPALNHPPTACQVLASAACPIALLVGDLVAAEDFLSILFNCLGRQALGLWGVWGRCVEGMLLIKRRDFVNGLQQLQAGIDELRDTGFTKPYTLFLGAMADGLAGAGRVAEGLASINEVLARASRNEELWCFAELLRIKGSLVLDEGAPSATAVAEDHFLEALDLARQQGALSWELRSATSLARLWRDQGRHEAARALLAPVYDRFTEGFATSDLRAAKVLIDELS